MSLPLSKKMKALAIEGREVKDPVKAKAREFLSHTVPDIQYKSRIVAICGITDQLDDSGDEEDHYHPANPTDDGWFFSDFFAFKHLLNTFGSGQTWITSEVPQDLVNKYHQYVHGNPYYDRKIVLDQGILDRGFAQGIRIVARDRLKEEFVQCLKDNSELARKNEESLVVLIFGHGDFESKAVFLGNMDNKNRFHSDEFKTAVGHDLDVTVLSTACFSGGWVVNPQLNSTILAAAGPEQESSSWNETPSIGRYCGSIYASTLMGAWRQEAEDAEKITEASGKEQQTYAAFASTVYELLLQRFDRLGSSHDIRFSAQDDEWEMAWGKRTGIPLISFRKNWDCLETYPATANPNVGSNRDPSVNLDAIVTGEEKEDKVRTASGALSVRFGGNLRAARRQLKRMGEVYLGSSPGMDNLASNTSFHSHLKRIIKHPSKQDWKSLNAAYKILEYRCNLAAQATELLRRTNIPLPLGKSCDEVVMENFESWLQDKPQQKSKYSTAQSLITSAILPGPGPSQGWSWRKPYKYVACAVSQMSSVTDIEEMKRVVAKLERSSQDTVEMQRGRLRECQEYKDRKRRWLDSIGKRVRSLSPKKMRRV